jgi:hypothetical protein
MSNRLYIGALGISTIHYAADIYFALWRENAAQAKARRSRDLPNALL